LSVDQYKTKYNLTDSDLYHHSYLTELSQRVQGENNPAYDHGGKFSALSTKFVNYANLSEEETEAKRFAVARKIADTRDENETNTTRIEYYLNKGLSREQAYDALALRQTTFSLEKCQHQYGDDEGLLVWQARQDKWMTTMKSKPEEEIIEINRKKIDGIKSGYSRIASEFFAAVHEKIEKVRSFDSIRYANLEQNISELTMYDSNTKKWYKPDFIADNKIIEFYGDYWHGNPIKFKPDQVRHMAPLSYAEIWEIDRIRNKFFADSGFSVLIIWEYDVRKNVDACIEKCIQFLKE
jgi:G:T-mismatch repair DNA endonuclease (very short patch repair protein)